MIPNEYISELKISIVSFSFNFSILGDMNTTVPFFVSVLREVTVALVFFILEIPKSQI